MIGLILASMAATFLGKELIDTFWNDPKERENQIELMKMKNDMLNQSVETRFKMQKALQDMFIQRTKEQKAENEFKENKQYNIQLDGMVINHLMGQIEQSQKPNTMDMMSASLLQSGGAAPNINFPSSGYLMS